MSKDIKRAIDLLEAKKTKPNYDDLKVYASEVERSAATLKRLIPDQAEAIDAIVASWEALLAQAKAGRKLKKVVKTAPDMTQSLLSGDPLGENPVVDQIVQGLNKHLSRISLDIEEDDDGEPIFHKFQKSEDVDDPEGTVSQGLASVLDDRMSIDVSPDDLTLVYISRDTNDRRELSYVDGAVLPDGSFFLGSGNGHGSGDYTLYKNARAAVRDILSQWSL